MHHLLKKLRWKAKESKQRNFEKQTNKQNRLGNRLPCDLDSGVRKIKASLEIKMGHTCCYSLPAARWRPSPETSVSRRSRARYVWCVWVASTLQAWPPWPLSLTWESWVTSTLQPWPPWPLSLTWESWVTSTLQAWPPWPLSLTWETHTAATRIHDCPVQLY